VRHHNIPIQTAKDHGIPNLIKKNASTGNLIERGSGIHSFSGSGNHAGHGSNTGSKKKSNIRSLNVTSEVDEGFNGHKGMAKSVHYNEKGIMSNSEGFGKSLRDTMNNARREDIPKFGNLDIDLGSQKGNMGSLANLTSESSNMTQTLKFAARTRQGLSTNMMKKKNQDAYFTRPNFLGNSNLHVFCVCDGHGVYGDKISQFVTTNLPIFLEESLKKNLTNMDQQSTLKKGKQHPIEE
jgi:hypothetical protein